MSETQGKRAGSSVLLPIVLLVLGAGWLFSQRYDWHSSPGRIVVHHQWTGQFWLIVSGERPGEFQWVELKRKK